MAVAKSDSCRGACILASQFILNSHTWEEFMKMVSSYWHSTNLPRLDEISDWRVYIAKPDKWFKHHSVVVENKKTGQAFTIEMVVDVPARRTYPKSKYFDRDKYGDALKETPIGECCSMSAKEVFRFALEKLAEFGAYHGTFRNCQEFSKELAEGLTGLKGPRTDVEMVKDGAKVTLAVGGAIALGGLLGAVGYGLVKLLSGSNDKKR